MKFGVGVRREGERRQAARRDVDAELLGQFADQRRLGSLAGVDLAAGKLPQPGHRLALRAAGEQDPAVGVDQHHRRDENERRGACGVFARKAPSCPFLHLHHPNPPVQAGEGMGGGFAVPEPSAACGGGKRRGLRRAGQLR